MSDLFNRVTGGPFMFTRFLAFALLTAFLVMGMTSSVQAEDTWDRMQTITAIHGNSPTIDNKEVVSIRGSVHLFWIPLNGTHFAFVYAGPKFQIAEWIWVSPQVGSALHWGSEGQSAALVSVWAGMSFFDGGLNLFIEGDGYFGQDIADYYGYYQIRVTPPWKAPISVGFQVEQVNLGATFGPQVSVMLGDILEIGLQYHVQPSGDDVGHALRVSTMLFLP